VKATLAVALTGNRAGDIGTLENDTSLDGDQLVPDVNNALADAIAAAINANKGAVVSAAEQILRDWELNESDGSALDPGSVFTGASWNPTLDFLLAVGMGDITVDVDAAGTLTNSADGATFFSQPVASTVVGISSTAVSSGENISATSANVTFSEDRATGIVAVPHTDGTDDLERGYIFIKLRITAT
jgi:hypothetical protein